MDQQSRSGKRKKKTTSLSPERKKSKTKKKRKQREEDRNEKKLTKKLQRYLQSHRLEKVKKLYKQFVDDGLEKLFHNRINMVYGEYEWSYLHEFASEGRTDLVDFLLSHGSHHGILDKRRNNFLHCAFNYVTDSFHRDFFYYLINNVISIMPQDLLTQRNDYGETAIDMMDEIFYLMQNRQKQYLEPESESDNEVDEKSWNERLFMEMAEDEGSLYKSEQFIQDEFSDTYRAKETFREWGDRMWREYNRKHTSKLLTARPKPSEDAGRKKRTLGPSNNLKELRDSFEILQTRERYEESCFNLFKNADKSNTTELTMDDIPWTHFPGYTTNTHDMKTLLEGMIKLFSYGFTDEDKLKYFKVQRIRWHPDRFLQKCNHRLADDEKRNKILELVKNISQKINMEISSFEKT